MTPLDINNLPLSVRKELLLVRANIERIEAFQALSAISTAPRIKQSQPFSFVFKTTVIILLSFKITGFIRRIRKKVKNEPIKDFSKTWMLLDLINLSHRLLKLF